MKRERKHPEEMSAAELIEATREFDEPFVFERGRPMTPGEKIAESRLRRARRKGTKRAKKISISLEDDVLKKADALARKKGINRSELISNFVTAQLRRRSA